MQQQLWHSFSDPLSELLSSHPESQFDLLETRHALEGVSAYYAALRGTDADFARVRESQQAIAAAQAKDDPAAEADAVMQYLVVVSEASHNVVLLHLVRCLAPLLEQNVNRILSCCMPGVKSWRRSAATELKLWMQFWLVSRRRHAKHRTVIWRLLRKLCWNLAVNTAVKNGRCGGCSNAGIDR